MSGRASQVLTRAPQVVTLAGLLIVWEVVGRLLHPRWLPPISAIAAEWWEMFAEGKFDVVGPSLVILVMALAVMFAAAALLAMLMATSRLAEDAVDPFINASLATPNIALIPVFTLLWGFSDATRIATIMAFAFAPVVVTWTSALKQRPAELIEMAHSFGSQSISLLRTVVLPAASPMLITGVRIGVIQGIKGLISAEVIVGVIGIGRLLTDASLTFDMPGVYAVIFTIIGLSIASYVILSFVERRSSRWARASGG